MTKWCPHRLRGKARERVMRLYLDGRVTMREAADLIGVQWRAVHRAAPAGFNWYEARARFLGRLASRIERSAERRIAAGLPPDIAAILDDDVAPF